MILPGALKSHPDLVARLRGRYSEPGRAYHNWDHILFLLKEYGTVRTMIADQDAVLLALYYHDAIYDPASPTNEEDSAELFREECARLVAPDTADLAESIILATKAHAVPDGLGGSHAQDCALFLDMDMAILGQQPAVYRVYADTVRQEYAVIPLDRYRAGRIRVLKDFLSRERLYITDHYHARLDAPARANLAAELARWEPEP